MPFSVMEKVLELRREVRMRKQVYRGRVERRQMTQQEADRFLGLMESILADYEAELADGAGEQGKLL